MKMDAFRLSQSIQRHVKKLNGYSHLPIFQNGSAVFTYTDKGQLLEITVREISPDEQLSGIKG